MEFIARGPRVHAKLTQSSEQMSENHSLTVIINPQKCHLSFSPFLTWVCGRKVHTASVWSYLVHAWQFFDMRLEKWEAKWPGFAKEGSWPVVDHSCLSVVCAQALAGRLNWVRLHLIADWPVWERLVLGSTLIAEVESPKPSCNFSRVGPGNRCRKAKGDLKTLD